jgi:glucose/arabinose dehydrogenase
MPVSRWCYVLALLAAVTLPCASAETSPTSAGRNLREVSNDLENATKLIPNPLRTDSLLVAERSGRVVSIDTRSGQSRDVVDIEALIGAASPRGLMSIAAHGSGAAFMLVVGYMDPQGDFVVGRFTVTDAQKTLDEESMSVVIKIARLSPHRLGSSLDFGADGSLFIATSDGEATENGATVPRTHAAQLPQSLLGKVIRIRTGERAGYSVPTDNPFVKQSSFQPEIYALGFRAPEAISVAPGNNQIFVLDSNERSNEVNLIERGKNYGWDALDGLECRGKDRGKDCDGTPSIRPVLALPKKNPASALVGGIRYQGERYLELRGNLVFADRSSGMLFAASEKSAGAWEHRSITQAPHGSITAIGEGRDGVIYAATDAGTLLALE